MPVFEKIKIYVCIALVFILAWLIGESLMKTHTTPQSLQLVQVPFAFDLNQTGISNYDKLEQKGDKILFKREPFFEIPVIRPSNEPKLIGILWDQDQPAALFDDHVLSIGDEIRGYKIVDITKDSATLSNGEESIDVNIGQFLPQETPK